MLERITLTFRRRSDGAEILATIDPEGNVKLTVRGAPGLTCRALTANLEEALGDVKSRAMHLNQSVEQHEAEQVKMRGGGFCG